jgi:hypothetical protein
MDAEVKATITQMIDSNIKSLKNKDSTNSIVNWFKNDVLIEDVALDWIKLDSKDATSDLGVGYIIGFLSANAQNILLNAKWKKIVEKLPIEKLNAFHEMTVNDKMKFMKSSKLELTKNEIAEIRELIKLKMSEIRTEVYRALGT